MSDVSSPPPNPPNPPEQPRFASPAGMAAGAAPPTSPGEVRALTRPTTWPKVLGILILVYACLGIIGNIYSIGSVIYVEEFLVGGGPMMKMQAEITQRWKPFTLASESLQGVLKLILAACGLAMMRRRTRTATLGKTWAWLTILSTLVIAVVTYFILVETFDKTMQAASVPTTQAAMVGARIGAIVGGTCGGLLPLVAPVALLVWLSLSHVKAEMARWAEGPSQN